MDVERTAEIKRVETFLAKLNFGQTKHKNVADSVLGQLLGLFVGQIWQNRTELFGRV